MKLESLQLEKFKNDVIKKEQLFKLNGGGTYTDPGVAYAPHGPEDEMMCFDFGYDSKRERSDGSWFYTYHNRSNFRGDDCIS